MAAAVASTPGSVGYLGSEVPVLGSVRAASIQTPAGTFVGPGEGNVTAAGAALSSARAIVERDWANASLVDAPGASSYPMVELVFATVYRDLGIAYLGNLSLTNATWLLSFFWWSIANGTVDTPLAGWAPLPGALGATGDQILENETYDGHPILESTESGGGETGEF
jgi:ABC-type phosphate transport system substrate-binding protein